MQQWAGVYSLVRTNTNYLLDKRILGLLDACLRQCAGAAMQFRWLFGANFNCVTDGPSNGLKKTLRATEKES